jgi:tetratricopeptide (TPR) repeat protein
LPLAPAYLTLAAIAAASRWPLVRSSRVEQVIRGALLAAVALYSASASASLQRTRLASDPLEVVKAGRILASVAHEGDRVISRKGHIGYYSGLDVVAFPRVRQLDELAAFARRRHAGYLYYSWYEATLRPELAFLLDPEARVAGLHPLYRTEQQPSVLYRIDPAFGRDSVSQEELVRRRIQQARVLASLTSDSTAAPHHALLAADALDRGRVDEAVQHAAEAIRLQPRQATSWTLMGDAQWAAGRPEDARFAYTNALVLDPGDTRARFGLGRVQLEAGERQAAARTWRPLVGRPFDPATARAMAEVFTSVGDKAAADLVMRSVRSSSHE